MPTRAEFEEEKHKRSSLGTFAEKPAEPKAYISGAPSAGTKFADDPFAAPTKPNTAVNPKSSGFIPTAEKIDPRAAAALRARQDAARRKVERERLAKRREERLAARRRQLRDRSAKQHGEPPESVYDNFYNQFDKDDIRRLKDKYLWTVQDNSIEQNLLLARRLGWPTGRGKDGHIFIVTPWGTRYRGNKPKKPKAKKKSKKKSSSSEPQGFWHGFTSSGGPVTIEQLRARVHRTPVITASAADLRARVHGKPEPVMATATSAWNSSARKGAAAKGIALPDGSYPIKDKRDWAKAKQALGRAKNRAVVVKHLIKRAKALGIPAEQYKGLTASSNTGMVAAMVAAMVASPLSLEEMNVGEWLESLHPRGRDGKFIDKFGFVSGRFVIPSVGVFNTDRAKVVGFAENTDDSKDPFVVVEKDGQRAYGRASAAKQVAAPKGSVSERNDETREQLDDAMREGVDLTSERNDKVREQLSLADAPIGGNKEMALDPRDHDYTGPGDAIEPHDPIVRTPEQVQAEKDVEATRAVVLDAILSWEGDNAADLASDAAKKIDVDGAEEIILEAILSWEGNNAATLASDAAEKIQAGDRGDVLVDVGEHIIKLNADDQGRERYDANEAAMGQRWAEMNAYRDSLTTPGKARYDELIGEGASHQEIMELFAREDAQGLEDSAAQTQADIATDSESNQIKTWRNDLAKVQDALEQGGWITSTPDADAPGGTFTYIDPDAPPELVALYQKLIQYGYANGYEP